MKSMMTSRRANSAASTSWLAWGCLAFAVATLALGWRDAMAGAWLGVGTIAFVPLALLRLVAIHGRSPSTLPAVHAEALAWTESGWGGPSGGQAVRVARPSRRPALRGLSLASGRA